MLEADLDVQHAATLDREGRITNDLVCRHCSYSLRGLSPEAVCPECGTSVRWSAFGKRLLYADPKWARRLATGTLWVLAAAVVSIVATAGGSVAAFVVDSETVSSVAQFIGNGLIGLVGIWLITTAEPGRTEDSAMWNVRVVTRIIAVTVAVGGGLAFGEFGVNLPRSMTAIIIAIKIVLSFLVVAGAVLLYVLLHRIATRIPDGGLARQTRVVMWGLGVSGTLVALAGVVMIFYVQLGRPATSPAGLALLASMVVFALPGAIGTVVFNIWAIVLLFRYRIVLRGVADAASKTLARYTAGAPAVNGG